MTSTSERTVVFIRLPGMDYVPAGLLRHEDRAYFFRYGRRYLERPDAIPLDPARMPLTDMDLSGVLEWPDMPTIRQPTGVQNEIKRPESPDVCGSHL